MVQTDDVPSGVITTPQPFVVNGVTIILTSTRGAMNVNDGKYA